MTKSDLVAAVQAATNKRHGLSKAAVTSVIDAALDAIAKAIKKAGRFQAPGLGTFTVRTRKARTGRNPRTGEAIKIKAGKSVRFKAAPSLKKGL